MLLEKKIEITPACARKTVFQLVKSQNKNWGKADFTGLLALIK
jgi:hypothetical protein